MVYPETIIISESENKEKITFNVWKFLKIKILAFFKFKIEPNDEQLLKAEARYNTFSQIPYLFEKFAEIETFFSPNLKKSFLIRFINLV